jgi:hypothetical protein
MQYVPLRKPKHPGHVVRQKERGHSHSRIIGNFQRFLFRLKRAYPHNRSKGFILPQVHVDCDIGENGGLIELFIRSGPTDNQQQSRLAPESFEPYRVRGVPLVR